MFHTYCRSMTCYWHQFHFTLLDMKKKSRKNAEEDADCGKSRRRVPSQPRDKGGNIAKDGEDMETDQPSPKKPQKRVTVYKNKIM